MATTDPQPRPRISGRGLLARIGPFLALIVLVLAAVAYEQAFRDPGDRMFLKPENLLNILRQSAPVGVVAVGMTFVIISGGIDLSVGSIVALVGGLGLATTAAVMDSGRGESLAIAAGVGVMFFGGALLGLVNGLLVTLGRIAPFIATLSTLAAYRSLVIAQADGGTFTSRSSAFNSFGSGGIPLFEPASGAPIQLHYQVLVFLAVAAVAAILLRTTTYGTYVRAVGDNERAAAYSAVRVGRVRLLTYTLSGAACGIAAVLVASRMNSIASSSAGQFYELDAIAAVVIGGARMQGGSGRILGTVIGVLILGVISNLLPVLGVGSYYHGLVKGLIIVAAVLVQRSPGGRA